MFCPNCGFKNSDGSKFCRKCGKKLPAVVAVPASVPATEPAMPPVAVPESTPSTEPAMPPVAAQASAPVATPPVAAPATAPATEPAMPPVEDAFSAVGPQSSFVAQKPAPTPVPKPAAVNKGADAFSSSAPTDSPSGVAGAPKRSAAVAEPFEADAVSAKAPLDVHERVAEVCPTFAEGLPKWDLVPPNIMVNRGKK